MSIIKSYSVGNGDMFYIEHNSDNFTIIDCCLCDDNQREILDEIALLSSRKGITRFISTHPDDDHIRGLELLDNRIGLANFCCVKNNVTKSDQTPSFARYCQLRDHPSKAFHIFKGCQRKWMNLDGDGRDQSGIEILWPNTENSRYKLELMLGQWGASPNNLSAIIQYKLQNGPTVLWMGDIETDFLEAVASEIALPQVDILFAPHHGRDSGRIPESLLQKMAPRLVVIGEAPSEHLCYYNGYTTICQNTAGDILFDCGENFVDIYTSSWCVVDGLLNMERDRFGYFYAGSLLVLPRVQAAYSGR